jgi:hypothetical protein
LCVCVCVCVFLVTVSPQIHKICVAFKLNLVWLLFLEEKQVFFFAVHLY